MKKQKGRRRIRRALALPLVAALGLVGAADAFAVGTVTWVSDGAIYTAPADASGVPVDISGSSGTSSTPRIDGKGSLVVWQAEDSEGDFEVFVARADGTGSPVNISNSPSESDTNPHISADGSTVVWSKSANGQADIYVAPSKGSGGPVNITNTPGINEIMPTISGDGSLVTWWASGGANGAGEVYVGRTDGTGVPLNLSNHVSFDGFPQISDDGSRVVWRGNRTGPGTLYSASTTGGPVLGIFPNAPAFNHDVSADGSTAVWQVEGGLPGFNILTAPADSLGPFSLVGSVLTNDLQPRISPDGTRVVWRRFVDGVFEVVVGDISGGGSPVIVSGPLAQASISPDISGMPPPDLRPIAISKTTTDTSVEGYWKWNVAKWTTSPLWAEIYKAKPYNYKVLVESHGFQTATATVISKITLTNPNAEPIHGTIDDVLPGYSCSIDGGTTVVIPANGSLDVTSSCTAATDPDGPVTNTATFTLAEAHGLGLQPVSTTATTTIDETPPAGSPGEQVVLRDPMYKKGEKVLKRVSALTGPTKGTASYSAVLGLPSSKGIAWCHNISNTARLYDANSGERREKSNKVTVRICKPPDFYSRHDKKTPKGQPKNPLPPKAPKAKDGTPKVSKVLGGPKYIKPSYRTKLRTQIQAPRRVYRGQLMRVRVVTQNLRRKKAYGVIVKAKLPRGMKLTAKPRNIHLGKNNTVWWTQKAIGPKKRISRTLKVVPIRTGRNRILAVSNARNAKRHGKKQIVRVMRAPANGGNPVNS